MSTFPYSLCIYECEIRLFLVIERALCSVYSAVLGTSFPHSIVIFANAFLPPYLGYACAHGPIKSRRDPKKVQLSPCTFSFAAKTTNQRERTHTQSQTPNMYRDTERLEAACLCCVLSVRFSPDFAYLYSLGGTPQIQQRSHTGE